MRKCLFILTILWFSLVEAQTDSLFSISDLYREVFDNHPVSQQAELIKKRGKLELSGARGFFDPKLESNYSFKEFDDKLYYDLWDSYLKLPTALNVDLKVGFEQNTGQFLNPQNNLPGTGLYYAGISVPLGEGLFINERTFALRQGKITQRQLENEAFLVQNNLFLDTNFTYWTWNASFQKLLLFQEALNLAIVRYEGIKQAVLAGDEASIDSVEITIQVQQFQNELSKSQAEFVKNTLALQNMLWGDSTVFNRIPTDSVIFENNPLSFYEDFAWTNHPDLVALDLKGQKLQVDRRMAAEQIKPDLNFNYNFLLGPAGSPNDIEGFQSNNYKGGINFSMPLLLRKERAKLKLTKVKISENDLKRDLKGREVINKIRANFNLVETYNQMIGQQRAAVQNYILMLEGERAKFANGESSVFLVNSRENKLVYARLKLIELEAAYRIYLGQLIWSSGYLPEFINSLYGNPIAN